MPKRKLTKHEDDIRRNLRKNAEINPVQSPHDGIHTCSKGCKKPGCNRGLRETIEEQNAQIEALKKDLLEQTAAVRHLRMERVHDLNHIGGQQEEIADLHSQFANSEQENARIMEELEQRCRELNLSIGQQAVQLRQIGELKAEVERLRKAGDELERVLVSRSGSYEAGNASHEWQSAKNYKPSV